jgi:hypothetical protein
VSRLHASFVLGYHGCEEEVGLSIVRGETPIKPKQSGYDWLGTGVYFWEGDPHRALEWAKKKESRGAIKKPFVIGAAIDLGNCLDLLTQANVALVRDAYDSFKDVREKAKLPMPVNRKAPKDPSDELVMRYRDCAVIDHLHSIIANSAGAVEPFDSVRGLFAEGAPIFEGSKLRDKCHAQIAVRNLACIKGIFLPIPAVI